MPYIPKEEREQLRAGAIPATPGQLNYLVSTVIDEYLCEKGVSYTTLNDVAGVLAWVHTEIARRIYIPYEKKKQAKNGEVFKCIGHL